MFPEKELCGISPNWHIQVSVSELYIPRIGAHIFLQQNRQTDTGNIQIAHRHIECWNWNWGRAIPFLGIHKMGFSLQCSLRAQPTSLDRSLLAHAHQHPPLSLHPFTSPLNLCPLWCSLTQTTPPPAYPVYVPSQPTPPWMQSKARPCT
jgi:hypothetical protein